MKRTTQPENYSMPILKIKIALSHEIWDMIILQFSLLKVSLRHSSVMILGVDNEAAFTMDETSRNR